MSESQLATSFPTHSLSQAASNLVSCISELFHRLRELESEETKLNEQARQLLQQLAKDELSTLPDPAVFTPVSKVRLRTTDNSVGRVKGTSHVDPRNIETPVKNLLLAESLAFVMSVRSKRKGRIFLGGDSTEFGEKIAGADIGTSS